MGGRGRLKQAKGVLPFTAELVGAPRAWAEEVLQEGHVTPLLVLLLLQPLLCLGPSSESSPEPLLLAGASREQVPAWSNGRGWREKEQVTEVIKRREAMSNTNNSIVQGIVRIKTPSCSDRTEGQSDRANKRGQNLRRSYQRLTFQKNPRMPL